MKNYNPLIHWLTVLGIGPIFLSLYEMVNHGFDKEAYIQALFFFIVFGVLYSLPAFLFYILAIYLLLKTKLQPLVIKAILNLVAITGIVITFVILNGDLTPRLSISYSLAFVASSFLYMQEKTTNLIDNRQEGQT